MNNVSSKELIDLYVDRKLSRQDEQKLFEALASDEQLRAYFRNRFMLRTALVQESEEIASAAEKNLFAAIAAEQFSGMRRAETRLSLPQQQNNFRIGNAFAYALALILVIITTVVFTQMSSYKSEVQSLHQKVSDQSRTIEMMYNSMPPITVRPIENN